MRNKFATFSPHSTIFFISHQDTFSALYDNSFPRGKEEESARWKKRSATFRRDWISSSHSQFPRSSARRNFSVTSSGLFAALRTHIDTHGHIRYMRTLCARARARVRSLARLHAAYVLQACWTKLWPVSIGRALRVVYRSTFWSCNTRPDTDRRGCAALQKRAANQSAQASHRRYVVHALRNCRPAVRFELGKNPLISSA